MNAIRIIGTAILSLLLGIAAPAYAQHAQQDEKQDHPAQQQSKHEQAKPEQQHAQQQQKQEQNKQTQQHAQQQQKQEQSKQTQQHAQQQQKQEQNKQTQQHAQQQQKQEQNKQRSSMLSNAATAIRSVLRNSSASSGVHGKSIAHNDGTLTTATGSNVAAITATGSLTTVTADTLAGTMGFASTACPSWSLVGTRVSNIRAIG